MEEKRQERYKPRQKTKMQLWRFTKSTRSNSRLRIPKQKAKILITILVRHETVLPQSTHINKQKSSIQNKRKPWSKFKQSFRLKRKIYKSISRNRNPKSAILVLVQYHQYLFNQICLLRKGEASSNQNTMCSRSLRFDQAHCLNRAQRGVKLLSSKMIC